MLIRQISVVTCVLATAGAALAGGPDLDQSNPLFDNGRVNPVGIQVAGDDFVSPSAAIYDNGGDNYANGNEMTNWLQAEDFTLANAATVGNVTFSILDTIVGNNLANFDGRVEWYIYSDGGGFPGGLIASGLGTNVVTSFDQNNGIWDFWDASFDLDAAQNLAAGNYWLGLHLNNNGCATRDDLYWGTTNANGTTAGNEQTNCGGGWSNNAQEHSFALFGSSDCLTMVVSTLTAGTTGTWDIDGATVGSTVAVVYGFRAGSTVVNGQFGYCATFGIQGVTPSTVVGTGVADGGGHVTVLKRIPSNARGITVLTQAAEQGTCPDECVSNLDTQVIQ